jgi:PAS domain-containing protein
MRDDLPIESGKESSKNGRQRLLAAVDSIPDSFVVWDKDLRFVDCNEPYRKLHADMNHLLVPGTKYEDYIRARVYSGRQPDLVGREEEWIKDRIHSMKTGLSDYEFCVKDKWYRVIRKQLDNGDHVYFQVNITAEKNREFELAESEELY